MYAQNAPKRSTHDVGLCAAPLMYSNVRQSVLSFYMDRSGQAFTHDSARDLVIAFKIRRMARLRMNRWSKVLAVRRELDQGERIIGTEVARGVWRANEFFGDVGNSDHLERSYAVIYNELSPYYKGIVDAMHGYARNIYELRLGEDDESFAQSHPLIAAACSSASGCRDVVELFSNVGMHTTDGGYYSELLPPTLDIDPWFTSSCAVKSYLEDTCSWLDEWHKFTRCFEVAVKYDNDDDKGLQAFEQRIGELRAHDNSGQREAVQALLNGLREKRKTIQEDEAKLVDQLRGCEGEESSFSRLNVSQACPVILLLGPTGAGKSQLAQWCGCGDVSVALPGSAKSQTHKICVARSNDSIGKYKSSLWVDTGGDQDTEQRDGYHRTEVVRAIGGGHISIILLVFPVSCLKMTPQRLQLLQDYKELLGNRMFDHAVVAISGVDEGYMQERFDSVAVARVQKSLSEVLGTVLPVCPYGYNNLGSLIRGLEKKLDATPAPYKPEVLKTPAQRLQERLDVTRGKLDKVDGDIQAGELQLGKLSQEDKRVAKDYACHKAIYNCHEAYKESVRKCQQYRRQNGSY